MFHDLDDRIFKIRGRMYHKNRKLKGTPDRRKGREMIDSEISVANAQAHLYYIYVIEIYM